MKQNDMNAQDAPLENDAVWSLLARAPMPEPDAWFAARTLARCRTEGRVAVQRFGMIWRWAWGGGIGVCLAVGLMVAQMHSESVDKQKNVQEAFEIVASMDSGNDSAPSSASWQDSSL
jgi:hypothetical protein